MRVELGLADDGRTVEVGVGDRVVVRLPENGGTGYLWQANVSGPGRLVDDRPEPAGSADPGASGYHRFEVAFDGSGEVALRAVQRRSWEPETNAVAEYRLELSVTG